MLLYSKALKRTGLKFSYFRKLMQTHGEKLRLRLEPWFDLTEEEFDAIWDEIHPETRKRRDFGHYLHDKPFWQDLLRDSKTMSIRQAAKKYGVAFSAVSTALRIWREENSE